MTERDEAVEKLTLELFHASSTWSSARAVAETIVDLQRAVRALQRPDDYDGPEIKVAH